MFPLLISILSIISLSLWEAPLSAQQLYLQRVLLINSPCNEMIPFTLTVTAAGGAGSATNPYNYSLSTREQQCLYLSNLQSAGSVTFTDITKCPLPAIPSYALNIADGVSLLAETVYASPQSSYIFLLVAVSPPTSCGGNGSVIFQANSTSLSQRVFIDNNGGSVIYDQGFEGTLIPSTTVSLAPGSYTIEFLDMQGCDTVPGVWDAGFKVSFVVPTLTSTVQFSDVTTTPVNCFGAKDGSIHFSIAGGINPITVCETVTNTCQTVTSPATNLVVNNLPAGTNYSLEATEANGCSTSFEPIVVGSPDEIIITATPNTTPCGTQSGSVNFSITGGTGTYSTCYANAATPATCINDPVAGSTGSFSDIAPGNYVIFTTDSNGCTATTPFTISSSSSITFAVVPCNATCPQKRNGAIKLRNITGGTPPYTASIGGPFQPASQPFECLKKGTYSVVVKDANGCLSAPQQVRIKLVKCGEPCSVCNNKNR